MRPSKTRSGALRRADRWFSKYIRLRDASPGGEVECITCGKKSHWRRAHAGHFVSRRKMSTRFEEHNASAQCPRCNLWGAGEQYRHGLAIDAKFGKGTAQRLNRRGNDIVKMGKMELDAIAFTYRNLAVEMAEEKGLEAGN